MSLSPEPTPAPQKAADAGGSALESDEASVTRSLIGAPFSRPFATTVRCCTQGSPFSTPFATTLRRCMQCSQSAHHAIGGVPMRGCTEHNGPGALALPVLADGAVHISRSLDFLAEDALGALQAV